MLTVEASDRERRGWYIYWDDDLEIDRLWDRFPSYRKVVESMESTPHWNDPC